MTFQRIFLLQNVVDITANLNVPSILQWNLISHVKFPQFSLTFLQNINFPGLEIKFRELRNYHFSCLSYKFMTNSLFQVLSFFLPHPTRDNRAWNRLRTKGVLHNKPLHISDIVGWHFLSCNLSPKQGSALHFLLLIWNPSTVHWPQSLHLSHSPSKIRATYLKIN